MTGYGKAEAVISTGKITIEIRTLNGKNADINIKTSIIPKDKELLVRQKLANRLQRGTIDFYATFEASGAASARKIDTEVLKEYMDQLSPVASSLGIDINSDSLILSTLLRFPDVVSESKGEAVSEAEWHIVDSAIDRAIDALCDYRAKEGVALYKDVTTRVGNILELENEVEALEPERIEAVRNKILKALDDLAQKPDQSRFEQEMIFYLEKFDINEEKVRLRQHCKYFMDTIDNEPYPGKKLGFIIQEMGREINTTGSKANNAGIQKAVVKMKDELEKIREQSMNIL